MKKKNWLTFFPVIITLVGIAAGAGFFIDGFYHKNASLMAAKFRIYDLVLMVLIIPLSIVMYVIASRGRTWAKVFVLGIIVYLAFSYGLNLFNCHQNQLFIVYIAIFSLSVFSIINGYSDITQNVVTLPKTKMMRIISGVLFYNGVSGYGFWISDAVNSLIEGGVSQTISGMNIPVNAAQVLDIGFMLPLAILGAVKLWKYHSDGLAICAVMLVFFMLIGTSVIVLDFGLAGSAGIEMDVSKMIGFGVTTFLSFVMSVFAYRTLSKLKE